MSSEISMKFSDVTDTFVVVKMPLEKYVGTNRVLEEGLVFAGDEVREKNHRHEKKLLRSKFGMWAAPLYGELRGWRLDSRLYLMHGTRLAGGLYVCDRNEFDEPDFGQVHYNYVGPAYMGRGLYSLLFQEAIRRATSWGLEGVIINTDRYLHPELYERWGGVVWKVIKKVKKRVSPSS